MRGERRIAAIGRHEAAVESCRCQKQKQKQTQKRKITSWLVYVLVCFMLYKQSLFARSSITNITPFLLRTTDERLTGPPPQKRHNCIQIRSDNASSSMLGEESSPGTFSRNNHDIPLRGHPDNVVLMGQFNFDTPIETVKNWVQIWSKYFARIVVAGPFSVKTQEKLKTAGIEFQVGADDMGYVSPYENLLDTMLDYKDRNVSWPLGQPPDAVIYLHDDALLNITRLYNGRKSLPNDSIMKSPSADNDVMEKERSYSIHVERERRRWPNGTEFSEVVPGSFLFEHTQGDGSTTNRTIHRSIAGLVGALPHWDHWGMCLGQQVAMLSRYGDWWEDFSAYSNITMTVTPEDESSTSSSSSSSSPSPSSSSSSTATKVILDGNETSQLLSRITYRFSFPGSCQADFLYMPLQYTGIFERAARPHIEAEVFLECAVPTIVHWIIQTLSKTPKGGVAQLSKSHDVPMTFSPPVPSVEVVPLCTDWSHLRGSYDMIMECIRLSAGAGRGMYHPLKLSKVGPEIFSRLLTFVQQ